MSHPTFEEFGRRSEQSSTGRLLLMAISRLSCQPLYSSMSPEEVYQLLINAEAAVYDDKPPAVNFVPDAVRTESRDFNAIFSRVSSNRNMRLLHAAMGKVTEAGELMDALKKHIFYGKPLDITNLKEELGDGMWYDAILCDELGWSYEEVQALVIAKLRSRFPDKFTNEKALERNLDQERAVLEGAPTAVCLARCPSCNGFCESDHSKFVEHQCNDFDCAVGDWQ